MAALLPLVTFGAVGFPALLAAMNVLDGTPPLASLIGTLTVLAPSAILWPLTGSQYKNGWMIRGVLGAVVLVPHTALVFLCAGPFWHPRNLGAYDALASFMLLAAIASMLTAQALIANQAIDARPGTYLAQSLTRRIWRRQMLLVALTMLLGFANRYSFSPPHLAWGILGHLAFQFVLSGAVWLIVADTYALWVFRHPWRHFVCAATPSALPYFDYGVGDRSTIIAVATHSQHGEMIDVTLRGDRQAAGSIVVRGLICSIVTLIVSVFAVGLIVTTPLHVPSPWRLDQRLFW